ncbi:MAG: hypothetical protein Q9226_006673 [Calogaya cf. arnoldii]
MASPLSKEVSVGWDRQSSLLFDRPIPEWGRGGASLKVERRHVGNHICYNDILYKCTDRDTPLLAIDGHNGFLDVVMNDLHLRAVSRWRSSIRHVKKVSQMPAALSQYNR